MLTRAIVRPPGPTFAMGLTTVDLGVPDLVRAREQFEAYCSTLENCGLTLTRLEADERYPDSTFVEDTAVLTETCTVLCRPGAISRLGEIQEMNLVLLKIFGELYRIREPGTIDGGDVCQAGNHFLIGISRRTNREGARQLTEVLAGFGYSSTLIDIRNVSNILHLKSGLAHLGENCVVVIDALIDQVDTSRYSIVRVHSENEYVANCVQVNDKVLVAAGYPEFEEQLDKIGFNTVALEMSEFRKMDGGLSCLSLRF